MTQTRYKRDHRDGWLATVEVDAREARVVADLLPASDPAQDKWDELALELEVRNAERREEG